VPLAEVYCSISENFHIVYTNKTRELSVEVTPAHMVGLKWAKLQSFLTPIIWSFERNGCSAAISDAVRRPDTADVVLTVPS